MTENILRRMREIIDHDLPGARFVEEQALAVGTKSTSHLTGMPRGGLQSRQVERGNELLEMAKVEVEALEKELKTLREMIAPHVGRLERQEERIVMRVRYMVGYNAQDTADILGYSVRHVLRVLQRAEQQILLALMSADVR